MASTIMEAKHKLESKVKTEFEIYKDKVLSAELITCFSPHFTSFEGNYLESPLVSPLLGGMIHLDRIPQWFRNEDNLIEILLLLAERNATSNFFNIIQISQAKELFGTEEPQETIDLMPILKKQEDESFFEKCGQLLLMAAIICGKADIVRHLILEREISPNFDLDQMQYTTPLMALIKKSRGWKDENEKCEMLTLLHKKGCNLNEIGTGSTKFERPLDVTVHALYMKSIPSSLLLKTMLELGASPFTFVKNQIDTHPLKEAHLHPFMNGYLSSSCLYERVELLLFYGSGLIKNKNRISVFTFERIDYPSVLNFGLVKFNPHCTIDFLRFKEIIFPNCLVENSWIYTAKELAEMLIQFEKFSPKNLKRTDLVCRHVLNAEKENLDIFPEGVIEAFRNYHQARKAPLLLTNEALSTTMPISDLRAIVMDYLDGNQDRVKECCPRKKPL